MKLNALLHDREHKVVLDLQGPIARVQIDDRTYELEVHEPQNGTYLFLHSARVHECRVSVAPQTREIFEVSINAHIQTVTISNPRRLRSTPASDQLHHGPAAIQAPMPGKVVRVLVEVGARVERASGIVVVEAMKMQNELKSPRAGVVVSISCAPGDTVNAGDVLALVE